MRDLHDLELLLRSSVPILVIETDDEERVLQLFEKLVEQIPRRLFRWTVTEGLKRLAEGYRPQLHNRKPTELLAQIKSTPHPGIYILTDFHPFLDDPVHLRYLKEIALGHRKVPHTVVLASHRLRLPRELEPFTVRFELSVPDRERLQQMVIDEAGAWARRHPGRKVRTDRKLLDRLVGNLLGLSESDAQRLVQKAVADGSVDESDLPEVMETKFRLLSGDGVLSFEHDTARFAEIGGLERLKEWLELREPVFTGRLSRPGLEPPKGILLLGVQGCGKSMAAKAVAGVWGVPLLRLDFGTLYNKFFGETERNLRSSLRQAETMAPCVLWVDEIEKGVSTGSDDSGTSRRVLGTLLTWMAEQSARVFIVATANEIEALPPELLRKGRLDEIFFVDLPDGDIRRRILEIHLRKRELDPAAVDLDALARACEGFSGAEIEQAVVSALYRSYARQAPFTTVLLVEEIERTRPLSQTMAERIAALRAWAAERTVPAN